MKRAQDLVLGPLVVVTACNAGGSAPTAPTSSPAPSIVNSALGHPAASATRGEAEISVPQTVEECFPALLRTLSPEQISAIRSGSESDVNKLHHGLGQWIRNEWGLWRGGPLKDHFIARGVWHPDDMSSIILEAFWCFLNGRPLRLDERYTKTQAQWRMRAPPQPDPVKPDDCPSKLSPMLVHVTMGADQRGRIIHAGTCPVDGAVWGWEYGLGWFRPDPVLEAEIKRGLAFRDNATRR